VDADSRERGKLYQDRLYGAKVLSPLAVELIDTPEFQRLAGLRQLGFADVAYRGAQHTRFEHSVGTYFLCRTILRRIVQNHDRLLLDHPGTDVSQRFATYPKKWAAEPPRTPSFQARWRGLVEIVSAAALLHDLGHVPFGHTLEDEFTGIYDQHDSVGGPRLYEMLFNSASGVARVFSSVFPRWIDPPGGSGDGITNEELGQLVYVILNWKERVSPPTSFSNLLEKEISAARMKSRADSERRLLSLQSWYHAFRTATLYHPFMSDVIGNTICADLLDYLPRDRMNLGMESRQHARLHRYFTIAPGSLYLGEGLRMSIMVTRKGRGGQRRDVATAVLDIMRERYEMAERVYYHHKKAAASTMLAKLAEFASSAGQRPRDDDAPYPSPWVADEQKINGSPHVLHLSDADLIEYLGKTVTVTPELEQIRHDLYRGLRFRREDMFRTLLVIDVPLVQATKHPVDYFAQVFRGPEGDPNSAGRLAVERALCASAAAPEGSVLVYCPSPKMQAKEVDVRLEIQEGRILPLRVQKESFAYHADLKVLEQYYAELWRSYIFVSPKIFADMGKCQSIVDELCKQVDIPREAAYLKVRRHDFTISPGLAVSVALGAMHEFIKVQRFDALPQSVFMSLLVEASKDLQFSEKIRSHQDPSGCLRTLLQIIIVSDAANSEDEALTKEHRKTIREWSKRVRANKSEPYHRAASDQNFKLGLPLGFATYCREVIAHALVGA